jgi:hypothetical protein
VARKVHTEEDREIGSRLGTTEQIIKNYLRSVFDKTGTSDRLELALFIIHRWPRGIESTQVHLEMNRSNHCQT